jgi:Ca2+-binding EF-hand superfamily protein
VKSPGPPLVSKTKPPEPTLPPPKIVPPAPDSDSDSDSGWSDAPPSRTVSKPPPTQPVQLAPAVATPSPSGQQPTLPQPKQPQSPQDTEKKIFTESQQPQHPKEQMNSSPLQPQLTMETAPQKSKPPEPTLPPPAALLSKTNESAHKPLSASASTESPKPEDRPKKSVSPSVLPAAAQATPQATLQTAPQNAPQKAPAPVVPPLAPPQESSTTPTAAAAARGGPRRSQSVIDDARELKRNPRELRRHLSLTSIPPTTFEHTAQSLRSGPFSKDLLTTQLLKRAKDPEVEAFLTYDEQDADIAALSGIGALPPDELTLYQLKGMFSVFDDDKDGHLTRSQLIKCLQLIGFQVRERLLDKYLNYRSPAVIAATTAAATATAAGTETGTEQPTKKKKPSTLSNKVSLNTFLRVTVSELPSLHSALEADLRSVFEVMDESGNGEISVKDLRHLLTETITPSRLSGNEFQDVLEACGLKLSSLRMEKDTNLNTETLLNNLLVGKRWRPL